MLVLTRRPNQSITIGDDIVVTVLEVKGDQIRLGISAPRDVQVFREEVLVALQLTKGPRPARSTPPLLLRSADPSSPSEAITSDHCSAAPISTVIVDAKTLDTPVLTVRIERILQRQS